MTETLLKMLVDRAVALDRAEVKVVCSDQAACDRSLKRLEELGAEAKVSVLVDSVGGVYLNWLHVKITPYIKFRHHVGRPDFKNMLVWDE